MLYHNFQKQPISEQPKKMNMLVKLGRGGVYYISWGIIIANKSLTYTNSNFKLQQPKKNKIHNITFLHPPLT